jgi:hypothetical protein
VQPIKIDHEVTTELLTVIFSEYVNKQGYSLSNLENQHFAVVRDYEIPSLSKVVNKVKSFDTTWYFKELESQGYVNQNGIGYNLTISGYFQGYKRKHYLKYFFREHWKVYVGFILTSLIVAVGLMNFLKTK